MLDALVLAGKTLLLLSEETGKGYSLPSPLPASVRPEIKRAARGRTEEREYGVAVLEVEGSKWEGLLISLHCAAAAQAGSRDLSLR